MQASAPPPPHVRSYTFSSLPLSATLNLIGLIVLLIMVAIVTLNYNKGLGDHCE